ncbi:hypothetical protein OZ411_01435 [Bradyrhizobium sp. Arg237L]|uniref:hypothetical protein n=1 Tax=Bradyrhizobium sp. Arg237L TaxID=3003352 RepID=UPI00249E63EC|nr:hypothetical protein [Bradyrhizobium sp. Arg237L]MDI4231476.1 hypothetical protein [Bradyrhizobium sp. Arg237L]
MNAGDSAAPNDVWLRPITNETHIKRSVVHHGQFKKWLAPPDDPQKPWKLELSGRLRSLVESIAADALKKVKAQQDKLVTANKPVPSALRYVGILHSTIEDIRAIPELVGDVIYDPTEDNAHANIVVRDKGPNEILTVTDILLKHLRFVEESDVATHPEFSSCA